jgi:hypothetical protein
LVTAKTNSVCTGGKIQPALGTDRALAGIRVNFRAADAVLAKDFL